MTLINFKERIQILLKLKESLIPQIDGKFTKDWEIEALNYQNTSENIMIELKNVNFIQGLVNAISAQLSYLRINLQNYENMSEQEKDKFKRLYVLGALGLIAKLKLILFFFTYINSVDHNKNIKNVPIINENTYNNLEQYNSENSYEDKMNLQNNISENCINNEDTKINSLFSSLEEYYSLFHNCSDDYKENVFNVMTHNNLVNYNTQMNNDKNLSEKDYSDQNVNMYDSSSNVDSDSIGNNNINLGNINHGNINHGNINHGNINHGNINHGNISRGNISHGNISHNINNSSMNHSNLKHNNINHNIINHNSITHNSINHNSFNHNNINHNSVNHNNINHNNINHNNINHNNINLNSINHSSINHSSINHSSINHSSINHSNMNGSINNGNINNGNINNGNINNGNINNGNINNGNTNNGNNNNDNINNDNINNGNNNIGKNYNSHFMNSSADQAPNMMNNFSAEKNENLQNTPVGASKKRSLQLPRSQNKTTNFLTSSQTLNGMKSNQNDHNHIPYYNEQLNNETQIFLQQNQGQYSKYLNNIRQNINSNNNENSALPNGNANLNSYYEYNNDNDQDRNILQAYNNKIYGISDNVYKNSYYL
ncbi:conserved Plasmodium protein, unknown function [Plasmodium malariae]|uniref:Uncharacterized protein n=1 Tax=Plasmodium malariae TaxID=5858 RepID=A0A1C3KDF1_PLAMA|nr:conserved Plasmodium protein, unknown function [Plasmodium malariae]